MLLNITGDSGCPRLPSTPRRVASAREPARGDHTSRSRETRSSLSPLRPRLPQDANQASVVGWFGGNRNALTKGMIESLDVAAPRDVGLQRAIAHVLGTLDDKIELNRRKNETIEAMAQALFKSWFVDFEPVRAKMGGRDTGCRRASPLFSQPKSLEWIPTIFPLDGAPTRSTTSLCNTRQPCLLARRPDMLFEHYSIPAHDAGQHRPWNSGWP